MARLDWQEQRQAVEAELEDPGCLWLLAQARAGMELPQGADGWRGVLASLGDFGPDHPVTDGVLRLLLAQVASATEHGPAAETVLLAAFWPMLEAVHTKKASWEKDVATRWSDVLWAFLRAIRRFQPERRRERISGKIYSDTVHDLYRECRRRWDNAAREIPHDPMAAAEMADRGARSQPGHEPVSESTAGERLLRLRNAGVINDVDLALLAHVHIQNLPLDEAAAKLGLTYEAAKKRKQRAEAAILKELERKK